MSFLNESRGGSTSIGFPILQDHGFLERGLDQSDRGAVIAVRVNGRRVSAGQLGHWIEDPETRGDMGGFMHWPRSKSASGRRIGQWREAFPAVVGGAAVTGGTEPPDPGTEGPGKAPPDGIVPPDTRVPDSEFTPGPGHWEYRDLAPGSPGGFGWVWISDVPDLSGSPVPNSGGPTPVGTPTTSPIGRVYTNDPSPISAPSGGGSMTSLTARGLPAGKREFGVEPARGSPWSGDVRFERISFDATPSDDGALPRFTPAGWPSFGRKTFGFVAPTTDEDRQVEVWMPTDPRLVAVHQRGSGPDGRMGTPVVDVDADGSLSVSRSAPLQSLVRVIRAAGQPSHTPRPDEDIGNTPNPGSLGAKNSLALNIGLDGRGETRGGIFADANPNSPAGAALAYASIREGGPLDCVEGGCQHQVTTDGDGNKITAMHLSPLSFFRKYGGPTTGPGGQAGGTRDGPLHFQTPWPNPSLDGAVPMIVRMGFNPGVLYRWPRDSAKRNNNGAWSWYAMVEVMEDKPEAPPGAPRPPREPPQPPPYGPPRDGIVSSGDEVSATGAYPWSQHGSTAGQNTGQPMAYTPRPLGAPAFLGRAHLVAPGSDDFMSGSLFDAEKRAAHLKNAPVVSRVQAYGKQSADATGFARTQSPPSSRYSGGTAQGMLAHLPPETDLHDIGSEFAPQDVSVSESGDVWVPGTRVAFGTPDTSTGSIVDGYSAKVSSGALVFEMFDGSGAPSVQLTMDTAGNSTFEGVVTASTLATTSSETFTPANDATVRAFDANSTSLEELADVVATLVRDLAAGKLPTV